MIPLRRALYRDIGGKDQAFYQACTGTTAEPPPGRLA
jgi:hypothetical protein